MHDIPTPSRRWGAHDKNSKTLQVNLRLPRLHSSLVECAELMRIGKKLLLGIASGEEKSLHFAQPVG